MTKPDSIKDLLKQALEHISAKEGIHSAWEEAAGKEASRHSRPARMTRGAIIINVDSPVWIYQLNLKKRQIEKRLGELLKSKKPITIKLRAGEE